MKSCNLFLIVFMFCSLSACEKQQMESQSQDESAPDIQVEVLHLRKTHLEGTLNRYGVMEPLSTVAINSDFSAPVAQVLVEEGQRVEQNQPLMRFDMRKINLNIEHTKHRLEQAKGQLKKAQYALQRITRLETSNSVSQQQLDNTQADFDSANALVMALTSELKISLQDLENAELRSPVAGVITKRNAEPGENALAFSTLLELEADYSIWVSVFVSESLLPLLNIGNIGSVTTATSQAHAQIVSIAANADPHTGNYELRLLLDNRQRAFKPGMTATVALPVKSARTELVIPESAIVADAGEHVVFVAEQDIARRRPVNIGLGLNDQLIILSGVKEDDAVIVRGAQWLVDGSRISYSGASDDNS